MKALYILLIVALWAESARACIWDSESLAVEKSRSHNLADAILHPESNPPNLQELQVRITELRSDRKEADPDWWNNLAGAYLRLNQPDAAVKLLLPVVEKFPNDYGIHANLGTAYHLLGNYAAAEKEIARDLEINPGAHFGLEKYHLALLQYLTRDRAYQARHVYVDEFTASIYTQFYARFYTNEQPNTLGYTNAGEAMSDFETMAHTNHLREEILGAAATFDAPPAYRTKWNLANDTNLEAGVIYMAQMNPKEPACFVMLGIAAWQKRDYHLAQSAFQKAIALGSPQKELLELKISGLEEYIRHSSSTHLSMILVAVVAFATLFCIAAFLWKILSKIFQPTCAT